MENKSFDKGCVINSSAQMLPHCLSAEFALSANALTIMGGLCRFQ
ncbi:hypothetical protein [Treponema putidum]